MDRYTKFVLSVIAVALMALVAQNAKMPAVAQSVSPGAGCGTSADTACFVRTADGKALLIETKR